MPTIRPVKTKKKIKKKPRSLNTIVKGRGFESSEKAHL